MNVLVVGDTHGNARWWAAFVAPAAARLDADLVVQLGDFGFWPSSAEFLDTAARTAVPVAFLDGNHEHHPHLHETTAGARTPVEVAANVTYLPRGSRLAWDGVTVAVLGGAHSIDRARRTPGFDWFAEEAVTAADLDALAVHGPAQVLLTHDAPLSAPVPLTPRDELPAAWFRELPACDEHRRRLDQALDIVQPELLIHGHYHVHYEGHVERSWGTPRTVGLACDGHATSSIALLSCVAGSASLRWVTPDELR